MDDPPGYWRPPSLPSATPPAPDTAPSSAAPSDNAPPGYWKSPPLPVSDPASPGAWHDPATGQPQLLTPRPLSQVGKDILNYGRVWGNQAVMPNTLDRVLSYLPGSQGYAAEHAATEQAATELNPEAAAFARWHGQNYSLPGLAKRFVPGAGAIADNPYVQAAVTGGGGTMMSGDFNPLDIAKNVGGEIVASKVGQAVGALGATGASWLGRTGKSLYQEAKNAGDITGREGIEALNKLQKTYQQGRDIGAQAEDLASQAIGEAKGAYQNIADAANQRISKSLPTAGVGTALGYLTGGYPWAAALGAGELGIKTINKMADVRNAINQAYPAVSGYVKSTVNPQNWRTAIGNFGLANAPRSVNETSDLVNRIQSYVQPWL